MKNFYHTEATIVTVIAVENLPDNLLGRKRIFTPEGTGKQGDLKVPWLEAQIAEKIRQNHARGNFEVINLTNPGQTEQNATVMIDPQQSSHELVLLGGGHIARPLVTIGRMLGYRVTVIDDRPEFASAERHTEAHRIICCSFDDLEKNLTLGPESSVIIITRGHKHDLDCLRKTIKYPLAYLGMVGSRRKIGMARQKLIAENVDFEKIDQVHMPLGLDIGAQTPEEIAVSIAAEMIKVRRGGNTNSLKNSPTKTTDKHKTEVPTVTDREALQKALEAAQQNFPAALATITRTSGSTPRKAGARMLIYPDGRTLGTIGGGTGESQVSRAALKVIEQKIPYLHQTNLNHDLAAEDGMVCGGIMEVFIEPVNTYNQIIQGGVTHD
jgi:xanthine dehydrogenase accessory factor